MKTFIPSRRRVAAVASLLLALPAGLMTGCASRGSSYYKLTLADPHPYPMSVIRTESKPEKKGDVYVFKDAEGRPLKDLAGAPVQIPSKYVAKVERVKEEPDKNDRELVESKPKTHKPTKQYFLKPFEFR